MSSGVNVVASGRDDVVMMGKKPRAESAKVVTTHKEQARVAKLLRRDRVDAAAELARVTALAGGGMKNLEDTFVRPTPEHALQVKFEEVVVEKDKAGRDVRTMRRVSVNRVKQLYDRGVFTDETYPAVLWYQRQFEAAAFTLGASAANWGEAIVGERSYGAMPKSAMAAEARDLFRMARGGRRIEQDGEISFESWSLPADMLPTFDHVVLDEMTIQEAATAAKCRYTNAAAAVKHVALLLSGRISHLLPTRAVGAPGGASETICEGLCGQPPEMPEIVPDGPPRGKFGQLDPIFIDRFGFLREWDAIAAITRMRVAGVADDEILAGLGE